MENNTFFNLRKRKYRAFAAEGGKDYLEYFFNRGMIKMNAGQTIIGSDHYHGWNRPQLTALCHHTVC